MEDLAPLTCAGCNASGTRLDLDTKSTPPELVCPSCKKKGKCDRCRRRVSRRVVQIPQADGTYFRGWRSLCLRCEGRF
jgi:hypothetical protein